MEGLKEGGRKSTDVITLTLLTAVGAILLQTGLALIAYPSSFTQSINNSMAAVVFSLTFAIVGWAFVIGGMGLIGFVIMRVIPNTIRILAEYTAGILAFSLILASASSQEWLPNGIRAISLISLIFFLLLGPSLATWLTGKNLMKELKEVLQELQHP